MEENKINEVDPSGVAYVDIRNLIKVFSSTEYDSLEKAASEIIDNAIDANAKNIITFLNSSFDSKRGKKRLSEIAFLDDGDGMTPGILQHVVGFGSSNHTENGKIGKFGIGMNQASLFACDKFMVYSWVSEDEVYLETFDCEYIINNNIDKAAPPEKVELPHYVKNSAIFDTYFKKHGTLIIWKKIKENKIAKPITIAKRMHNEFGRVYRNFINSGNLHIYTQADTLECVHAIDPMFLLENTDVLGDIDGHSCKCSVGEPLFEIFANDMLKDGCKEYQIPYYDKNNEVKYSKVILKAAIIKEKFYYQAALKDNIKQPGDTEIGSYVKEFQKGITIVRNNREIDFNYFGFYDSTNQPQDRWFKLEIQFSDELDEIFHVSNNKQHVELKKISETKFVEYREEEPNYPIWLRLKPDINKLLSGMRNRNRLLATKAKTELIFDIVSSEEKKTSEVKQSLDVILNLLSPETPKEENKITDKINDKFDNELKPDIFNQKIGDSNYSNFEKSNVVVSYENNNDLWVIYRYDFNLRKYIISFNKNKIKNNMANTVVEYMIVSLCIMICDETESSSVGKKLVKLLSNYEKKLCGGF